jgi:hypothetical protein
MRLPLVCFALALLSSTMSIPAQGPIIVPVEAEPFTFEAGSACTFPVRQEPLLNKEVAKIFPPEENGDQRVIITGSIFVELTNLDTGKSKIYNISGPGIFVFHPDGSISIDILGRSSINLLPTSIPPGPQFFVNSGRAVVEIRPDGLFTIVKLSGNQEDICAALS